MALIRLTAAFLICHFVCLCTSASVRVLYEKCGTKGFTCNASKQIAKGVDVTYQCSNENNNSTGHGQDVTLYLWNFNSPAAITSLTIKNCETLRLSFTCTSENKPIQWLRLQNIKYLEILQPMVAHNPPQIYLENISYIDTLPRDTFVQVKKTFHKPGCFIPVNDLDGITFKNVKIGTIETEAFRNLTDMKTFSWQNVSVERINLNAIHLTFESGSRGSIDMCYLNVVEPLGMRIVGDGFSITRGRIGNLWGSGVNGTIYDFAFNNNTIGNIQSNAIAILALNVQILDNNFQSMESGAFQKISPGLLHDSRRNFGKLIFTYRFSNNLLQSVEDGGIRPDIAAYKNVAAEVTFTHNTLQCSCEGLTWLGADVDLGYGYSVLKDFNTMIMDPRNSNMCSFTPCMCFGVRSPNKKSTAAHLSLF